MSDTPNQDQNQNNIVSSILAAAGANISSLGTGQVQYPMPPRVVAGNRGMGVSAVYTGPNLVDENNNVTNQGAYDTSEDYAKFLWGSLTPQARQNNMEALQAAGMYSGQRS